MLGGSGARGLGGIVILLVRAFLDWLTFRLEKLEYERQVELATLATAAAPSAPSPPAADFVDPTPTSPPV